MKTCCPSCGAEMDVDVLLAHEDSRAALAAVLACGVPLGRALLQYLRLFKPAHRQLGQARVAKLLEPLMADMALGFVERAGRQWPAPRAAWQAAIEQMLDARDTGKLALPLKSHAYLYAVIAGMADKAEAGAEREAEQRRKARAHVAGPAHVAQAAALAVPDASQCAAGTLDQACEAPRYAGPSRAALEKRAQIAAAIRSRSGPPGDGE